MRKFFTGTYMVILAVLVLSLSGCGGSSSSFVSNNNVPEVAEVAAIESTAFELDGTYRIVKGAVLNNMSGAKYYVNSTVGNEDTKAALNLGFSELIGNQTLTFIKMVNGKESDVVFAYDPTGTNGNKTSGRVTYSGGSRLRYTSLVIPPSFTSSMNADTSNPIVIQLNGDSALINGEAAASNNYVWHADPYHRDEYYTLGLDGTTEYDEDAVLAAVTSSDGVYINRDIRYLTDSLDFTGTVANDEEQEYAAYYSESIRAVVSDELGGSLTGPYIFATLPMSGGGMGGPGGGMPGSDMGGTPPEGGMPSGDMEGTPPERMAASVVRNRVSNSDITAFSSMTHSAEEAYANPVLHITRPGVYSLQGTWNGQIWIDVGGDSTDKVVIILNSTDVTCTVAPALVFKKVYECGPDDESAVASRMAADSSDIGNYVMENAGAMVVIADDTVNSFTGANVYRMLKPQKKKDTTTTIDGTDVSQQKKRYKMDGAFYSYMSMAMGGGEKGNGILNVTSTTYEGVNTEMHMTFENGVLNVSAEDDGMNFNEDNVSVFTMLSGEVSVSTPGGDGIDSNGYIVILGGTLDIRAAQDSDQLNAPAEGPLDADCGVYMADGVNYTHGAYSSGGGTQPVGPTPPDSGDEQPGTPAEPDSGDRTPDSGDEQPETPANIDSGDRNPESGDNTPPEISTDIDSGDSGNEPDDTDSGSITPGRDEPRDEPDIIPSPQPEPSGGGDDNSANEPTDAPDIPYTPSEDGSQNVPGGTDLPVSSGDNQGGSGTPTIHDVPGTDAQTGTDSGSTDNQQSSGGNVNLWDTDTVTISTPKGITTVTIGGTRASSLIPDPDYARPREVNSSGAEFILKRRVNTFSGIK